MAEKEVGRIFVGGLSWETTERTLERTFGRFGKVIETQVVVERDTGRSRGFGFVTFAEPRAVDAAIEEMHNGELDGRTISVNKAQPRMSSDDGYGYGGNAYSSGARGGYRSAADTVPSARDDCFKCGRPGHWARECPYSGGGRGSRFSPSSRYGGGSRGRGDRFGGSANRYVDDRYDGGRYLDRDLLDSRDGWYGGGRDRYTSDRYLPTAGRFSGDRYGAADRYPQSGYGRERSYERDGGRTSGGYYRDDPRGSGGFDRDGPRIGGSDKYGSGGPARFGGNYRDRPGPYDRPSRGGRPYDDRY